MTKKLLVILLFNLLVAAGLGALLYHAIRRSSEGAGQRAVPPSASPTAAPSEAQAILNRLNNKYGPDLIEIVECPEGGIEDDGEINGWISARQEELDKLGFVAKWNRERRIYELYKKD